MASQSSSASLLRSVPRSALLIEQLISVEKELDLALIKLQGTAPFAPTKLSRLRAQIAQTVFILGFPQSSELSLIIGSVSSLKQERGGIGIIAATSSGMAGSPVFNEFGEVIAMVSGILLSEQQVTIAYPVQLASGLLEQAGINR
jgi:S1-C subfamily serine protease